MKYKLDPQLFGGRGASSGGGGSGGGGAASSSARSDEANQKSKAFDPMTASLDELYQQKYNSFDSELQDDWDFVGKGEKETSYFRKNSNFDNLINKMDYDEQDAFRDWARGVLMHGEQYRGWDNMPDRAKDITATMDKYIDNATLKEGIVVKRRATAEMLFGAGKTTGTAEDYAKLEGITVKSKGALSTAAAKEGLTIGAWDKEVEYSIHIPEGSTGACMWIGDNRINGWSAKQREVVMNRDSYYKVGKRTYNKSRKLWEVDVFWIGRDKHDYGKKGRP